METVLEGGKERKGSNCPLQFSRHILALFNLMRFCDIHYFLSY